ncbi:MAG TPA: anti-sigma factor [Candidatus Binataceae bacterium]|nr:anti-sigma factor [Candidatus Binataceae bacterium]
MNCEEAGTLLQAYVDGELDLIKSLEVETHLGVCAACTSDHAGLRALRSALRNDAPYYKTPSRLEARVRAAIRDARRAERGRRVWFARYAWVALPAAAVILAAIVVKGVLPLGTRAGELTAREVLDDHLRSLAANHLTDVLSSNQHTVKPWFDGRLDFTPPVKDLAADGFPLIGGRLDYLNNRPAAAIVYRRRQHVINLLVAPAENAADSTPAIETREGYNIAHWVKSGMAYWAVSSVSAPELVKFAQLVQNEDTRPSSKFRNSR